VPTLWDRKLETIVNNESSEIIRMLYTAFDAFVEPSLREDGAKPLLPASSRKEIEAMNEWVYDTVNNGVYKAGFAAAQEPYDKAVAALFASLDRLEEHLAASKSQYLFGEHVTEADVRLYPTLVRFDAAYHTLFRCNLKMIRHDYPLLHAYVRNLYWDRSEATNGGAFGKTTHFPAIKFGYTRASK
jgi:putative glutathione S-transferase